MCLDKGCALQVVLVSTVLLKVLCSILPILVGFVNQQVGAVSRARSWAKNTSKTVETIHTG